MWAKFDQVSDKLPIRAVDSETCIRIQFSIGTPKVSSSAYVKTRTSAEHRLQIGSQFWYAL